MGDHAGGGVEPEGRATRQHEGVDRLHRSGGIKQVGLAGAGAAAAHVHRAGEGRVEYERGDAARDSFVFRVADADSRDVGDAVEPDHRLSPADPVVNAARRLRSWRIAS
jgi:hypothetical protein